MVYALSVVIILFFTFNFYQDVVSRSIYLVNLPLAALLMILYAWITHSFVSGGFYLLVNVGIITFQVLGAWIFILVTKKGEHGVFKNQIAFADIFFLFLPVIFFSPFQFLFFELMVLSISLIVSVLISGFSKGLKPATVPLAGNIGLGLALIVILETFAHYPIRDIIFINL
jgi:hypothetical protein